MKRRTEIFIISVVLILQSFIFAAYGSYKQYLHMDEVYSLGLSNYNRVEIQENEDFYNNWHNSSYYSDYLVVESDELYELDAVYENQKNDVHPPFYYLLLRLCMNVFHNKLTFWHGIILNIFIYAAITLLVYLIVQRLFLNCDYIKEKAIITAALSSLTSASITNVLFIRMYSLSALFILATVYLHIKLRESAKSLSIYVFIGLTALMGSLTHYYYLFFLFATALIFSLCYFVNKQFKLLFRYIAALAAAGAVSLAVFPYSVTHLLGGYRGQGAVSNLKSFFALSDNFFTYVGKLNRYGFNCMLILLLTLVTLLWVYKKLRCNCDAVPRETYVNMFITAMPSMFYFTVISVASPYIELRYILPVCTPIFCVLLCYLYHLLRSVAKERLCNVASVAICCILLFAQIFCKIEPESVYSYRASAVEYVKANSQLPTVYIYNTQCNRFLDDIYLFSVIENSYVAKDIEVSEGNIQAIFAGKDSSNGVAVFINEGQNDEAVLNCIAQALELQTAELKFSLNACKVYKVT